MFKDLHFLCPVPCISPCPVSLLFMQGNIPWWRLEHSYELWFDCHEDVENVRAHRWVLCSKYIPWAPAYQERPYLSWSWCLSSLLTTEDLMNIHSVSSLVNIRSHQMSTRMSFIPSRLLVWEFDVWTLWVGKDVGLPLLSKAIIIIE